MRELGRSVWCRVLLMDAAGWRAHSARQPVPDLDRRIRGTRAGDARLPLQWHTGLEEGPPVWSCYRHDVRDRLIASVTIEAEVPRQDMILSRTMPGKPLLLSSQRQAPQLLEKSVYFPRLR